MMSLSKLFFIEDTVNKNILGCLLAAIAATLWGSTGTAQSFISQGGPNPLWVGAFRLFFACCFFLPLLAFRKNKNTCSTPIQPQKAFTVKILVAGLSMAFFNLLFFSGVKILGVALGSCLIIGSAPLWAGFLEFVFYRNLPSQKWMIGIIIAISGGALMAISQAQNIGFSFSGLMVCLSAGFCYSLYSITAKSLVQHASPLKVSTYIFLIAVSIATPVAWLSTGLPSFTLTDMMIVLYLGIVVTGIAYLLYSTALKIINVSTAVSLGLLEPVVAFTLAIIVVNEPVSIGSGIGLVAILSGLLFVLKSETQNKLSS